VSEIDYALAWDFIDTDGRPYQLRFRCQQPVSYDGQLIAVIAKPNRPDKGHTIAISRPGVNFHDVEAALTGWQSWARLTEHTVNLGAIRRCIHDKGLA
jgi:hypothetical protein